MRDSLNEVRQIILTQKKEQKRAREGERERERDEYRETTKRFGE